MERIEYDPKGPDYLPVTEHETGSTLMVAGVVMLIAGGAWGLFVGWDIRGGTMFMQLIFVVDVLVALFLIAFGFMKKRRATT